MKIGTLPFILVAILFWASSFVGIRAALVDYDPIDIAVLRFVISSIVLLLIAIPGKLALPDRQRLFSFFPLGLVLAINAILLNYGVRTITAGETTLIVSTSQLLQVLLAVLFLNEKISTRFLVGLSLCFVGITVIAFSNSIGLSLNIGIIFLLFAAIANATFFILQKPLLERYRPLEVISYAIWIATLIMLPFGYNVIKVIPVVSTDSTMVIIYIGIAVVIAHLCWAKVLSRIEATKGATILYSVPVMTIVIGFLWLDELPSIVSCLGGAIILGGVILSNLKKSKHQFSL
jgi:drug/metabolite transporter (DMT)-like permease